MEQTMLIDDREQVLQTLSAMLRQLSMLQSVVQAEAPDAVPPDMLAIRSGVEGLEQMTREALSVILASTGDVLPPQLEEMTLPEALSRLVEETAEKLNLSSRVSFAGIDEEGRATEHTPSPVIERVLYTLARETLGQVEQHRGARKLRLSLNYGQDEVQM